MPLLLGEQPIFTGAKNIVGSLELDGFLNIDTSPGSDKVTNGGFATDTGWTKGANWAIAAGVATHTAGDTATLSQDTGEVANEIYQVVFTVSNRTAGSITVAVGGVSGTARSSNATFTEYITATGTGNLTFTPSNDFDGNLDDVSVKRVGVVAADRVTAWVADRVAAGLAQAGKAGFFVQAEDGTRHFLGDITQLGGQLLINSTESYGQSGGLFETHKLGASGFLTNAIWFADVGAAAVLDLCKSRGAAIGTHTIIASGDTVGHVQFRASDGTAFREAATISGEIDGTPGASDMPGRLIFKTTKDGQASGTEALRIDKNQKVSINAGASPDAGQFQVNGAAGVAGDQRTLAILYDTTAMASGVGAGILLGGHYLAAGGLSGYGFIKGIKENATDNNYAGALVLGSVANGGNYAEAMRIASNQRIGIGGITAPRAILDIGTGYIVGTGLQLPHVVNKAASATARNTHNAEATSTEAAYTKVKTITLTNGLVGAARFLFDLKTSDITKTAYGRIYRNGVALGSEQTEAGLIYATKSEDLTQTWNPGDTAELYIHNDGVGTTSVQNFQIAYDDSATVAVASANS